MDEKNEHDNKCRIVIFLNKEKDGIDLDIALNFQFALLAEDETVLISSPTAENCIFQERKTFFGFHLGADEIKKRERKNWNFKLKQTKKELVESKNIFLKDNVLSLNCECTICTGVYLVTNEKHDFGVISSDSRTEIFKATPRIPSSNLQNHLMSMYDDAILSDMELRTWTKTFRVHKNILSARSPVFRAMFQADMKENAMKYVEITDLDDETLDKMLLYFYNGIFEVHHWESASELYQAANKYQILTLKRLCSEFLASWICATNACKILMLADMHEDEELKKCAQTYILSEKNIMCSDNWKKFMNDNLQLAAEIMYWKCTEQ
ncbi:TD and POZ domain-containing protein 1 [Caerostris extrusa]|uniref:TD and POZ domain-containing protein 1 n=1 Tax=Caerostris extrusa TaxID=172846 RepID=A0AAV4MEF8_CAEEX|nr:TD and POZ domain-containing protein 1 [Caerostris extrusa]